MLRTIITVGALALALSACNVVEKVRDPGADQAIRATLDQLRSGDAALMSRLTPEAVATTTPQDLATVRRQFPSATPLSRKMVGTSAQSSDAGTKVVAQDEYRFASQVALVTTQVQRAKGAADWRVAGFHIQVATDAQLEPTHFFAPGKTINQYLFLLLTVAMPLSMVAALVKVVRTKGLKRKWLWGVVAFLGLGAVQMNWMTGEVAFNALTIQAIGGGAFKAGTFAPWVLTFTLPVGALLILSGVLPWRKRTVSAKDSETAK